MGAAAQHHVVITSDMLAAFLKVAELGGVSRAADALGVTKSQVSKRVALLEHTIQATLFSRSTRRVVLTPAGEVYREFAQRAVDEMSAGVERLRSMRSELVGSIRLTAPVSWGQHVLSRWLPDFLRMHPGIDIELQLTDRRLDLARERIDIALRWSTTQAPELLWKPVARVGWVLAASPAYLTAAGMPATPADLAHHTCLAYWREKSDDAWLLVAQQPMSEPCDEQVQITVKSRYHVDNPEAVLHAALAGIGIALLPDYVCSREFDDGQLLRVLPEWTPHTKFGNQIVAIATPERMNLSRNRAFLDFLIQQSEASA